MCDEASIKIREANVDDSAAMGRTIVETFLESHRGQIPDQLLEWRRANWTAEFSGQNWKRAIRNIEDGVAHSEIILVAESPVGDIVGLAMAVPSAEDRAAAEICALYVRGDRQRQGIGRALVAAIARRLLERGMAELRIGALQSNASARRFYEALGGRIVGEREIEDAGFTLQEVVYGYPNLEQLILGPSKNDTEIAARDGR